MNDLHINQATPASITLAAAVAFAVFGTGAALAAPPTGVPTFVKADISIEPRGEVQGALNCSFRETGLGSYAQITYTCNAGAVGVREACFYKNKLVAGSPTEVSIFTDVTNVEGGHAPEALIANNNGAINGTIITAIPEAAEGGGGHPPELCNEPWVARVVAARWCDASLTDTTNNLVGVTAGELFQEFTSGVGTVPSCSEMLPPAP